VSAAGGVVVFPFSDVGEEEGGGAQGIDPGGV
jgi:hypothetical protein